MVTAAPTAPEIRLRLLIESAEVTVKVPPLLAMPFTVATTGPVVPRWARLSR